MYKWFYEASLLSWIVWDLEKYPRSFHSRCSSILWVSLSQDYIPSKYILLWWISVKCKQIWLRAFKWATIHDHRSRDCKTVTCQIWRSEKIALLVPRSLSKMGFGMVLGRIFFGLWSLKGHSFAAPWPMMMHSNSLESPKPYLFDHYLKNSITSLWRYVIFAQMNPILSTYVIRGCKLNVATAQRCKMPLFSQESFISWNYAENLFYSFRILYCTWKYRCFCII